MKFDVLIIGGGLAGLSAGLRLQKKGKRTAIVSAGQNALHFSSGSFGILERLPDGTAVEDPIAGAASLGEDHPYRKIGAERMVNLAESLSGFLGEAGVSILGNPRRNGFRLTPTGTMKAAALSLEDVPLFMSPDELSNRKVLIVNLLGFMDFQSSFLALGLEKMGCSCRMETLHLPELERLRNNPSEMRSVNIARVLDPSWIKVADEIKTLLRDEDLVILPQVFGLLDGEVPRRIREAVPGTVLFVGTMPPSVPGIRTQIQLKKAYERAGGSFLMGDEALSAEQDGDRILSVTTRNLGPVEADTFILATGSYFSKGIAADMNHVFEPLFGLDVVQDSPRNDWYDPDFFRGQPFMGYGVRTDAAFRACRNDHPLSNLYAIGSVLGETHALTLGCGAGVALLTALSVADSI